MIPITHSLDVLLGRTGNPFHTLIFWMKIECLVLIPQYFYLIFNNQWTRLRLYLRTGTELILGTGCVITLQIEDGALQASYPDLPERLANGFHQVVWFFILAVIVSIAVYWYKASQAFKVDMEAQSIET